MSQPLFRESPRRNCFLLASSARVFVLLAWCGLMVLSATAAVRYVNLNNPTPAPPYTNWATAAQTIQDAVDVTVDGDEVLVTNGVYRTGARLAAGPTTTMLGTVSNRVTITNSITLRSVNGPQVTIIEGTKAQQNLAGQTRCVSLSNNAVLTGFTLSNGSAAYVYLLLYNGIYEHVFDTFGGGVRAWSGAVISNCVISRNMGGANGGVLFNCVLRSNLGSYFGAAAWESTLNYCVLENNHAERGGGGAYQSILNYCEISGNSVLETDSDGSEVGGGGVLECVLNHCLLTNNWAVNDGGGASQSKLTNCTLIGNSALQRGGGVHDSILVNCKLSSNHAEQEGGGAFGSWLYNCTVAGNSSVNGGGVKFSQLTNSIVYHNIATNGADYLDSTFHFSCTSPLPVDGTGNLTNEPAFLDWLGGNLRLASNSPCQNAGDNAFASGATDLDGRARVTGGTVDMGAYEFQPGVSGVFLGWLEQFGLRTDGTDDTLDPDGDHANNFQEWRAGTIPTNALSALRLLTPTASGPDFVLRWPSVPGQSYFLTRSTNLTTGAGFVPFAQNLPGQPGTTTYTDTNAASGGGRNYFYRVGVEP